MADILAVVDSVHISSSNPSCMVDILVVVAGGFHISSSKPCYVVDNLAVVVGGCHISSPKSLRQRNHSWHLQSQVQP
jgi:hypothetical protein